MCLCCCSKCRKVIVLGPYPKPKEGESQEEGTPQQKKTAKYEPNKVDDGDKEKKYKYIYECNLCQFCSWLIFIMIMGLFFYSGLKMQMQSEYCGPGTTCVKKWTIHRFDVSGSGTI